MVKKTKKTKKQKLLKSLNERTSDVVEIRKKMSELGMFKEQIPELQELFDILEHFRVSGESWTGKVKLESIDKYIVGFLTTRAGRRNRIKMSEL